jgi:4-amino-4-deoxy-L-arabinose transferase-like glycosyltransferase
MIVGFDANNQPIPQELPVWQATAAALFKAFGTWFGWANVASLLFAASGLWPLFHLAARFLGQRGAWWTLVFYCAQPLVFYYAGSGGTDGSCEAFAIWFLFFAESLVRTGNWGWWPATFVFGALSAVTKLPFFFSVGLASFFLLLLYERRSVVRWAQLASAGVAITAVFGVWQVYTDGCLAKAEFALSANGGPQAIGTEAETAMRWYFGSLSYRLNPTNWVRGAWRFGSDVFGSFALAALPLWSLFYSRTRLGQFWLGGCVATTLVFTHVVLTHHHYYLMFTPAIAVLAAEAALKLEQLTGLADRKWQSGLLAGALAMIAAATLQGLSLWTVLDPDPYPHQISELIRQYTGPKDKLLLQGDGWDAQQLLLSGREGLSIWNTWFLEDPKNLARIQQLGYTRLVMLSESPLHHAVRITRPGQARLPRDTYGSSLTQVGRGWKTLLETDDVLIKEVPPAEPTAH